MIIRVVTAVYVNALACVISCLLQRGCSTSCQRRSRCYLEKIANCVQFVSAEATFFKRFFVFLPTPSPPPTPAPLPPLKYSLPSLFSRQMSELWRACEGIGPGSEGAHFGCFLIYWSLNATFTRLFFLPFASAPLLHLGTLAPRLTDTLPL